MDAVLVVVTCAACDKVLDETFNGPLLNNYWCDCPAFDGDVLIARAAEVTA